MDVLETPAVTFKVIGNQWYWHYEYCNTDVQADLKAIHNPDISEGLVGKFKDANIKATLLSPFKKVIPF